MAISWPARIKDKGGLREQFMHVIDVVPTILEVTGIPAPETVDGVKQAPIEGTSFAYTFDAKNSRNLRTQDPVFRDDGPVGALSRRLAAQHQGEPAPWEAFGAANTDPLNNQVLELYDLNNDFSQSKNIADQHPDK